MAPPSAMHAWHEGIHSNSENAVSVFSSQQEKCLLISDVLNLRQRVGTLASVDEQMPPPPPTPQLQKQLLVSISSNSKRDFRSPSVAAGTTAIGILQKSPPALWQNDANLDGSCCSAV